DRLAVLVPAWQPEERLAGLAASLLARGFGMVIVVNDGSDASCSALFEELALLPRVRVLQHAVNLGKGRALKTGINHFLTELPEMVGLVTADADGQHTAEDTARVAEAMQSARGEVVLGSRRFTGDVPLRSRLGNGLTRQIFAFITGAKISDTQTGLRAFPRKLLPELVGLSGERYEYEMTVLAHVCRQSKPVEVPIETVYIDGNRSSHFDPVRDSMRIYFVLVRFYFSALVAAGIDFAGFSVAFAATHNLLASVAVGRLSSLVNFALNRRFVFHNHASLQGTFWRYYALVAAIGGLSYLMIWPLTHYARWNVFAAKVAVDTLLSLISFAMQRTFVFRRSEQG
ncbi:MAG TPA: bifunctional glycosyltransferase family 2/GtrA family protein, partial [Granulicella sp.]|nr:bifunctional glycosyltransferase family 2/GtrA family protein [Granulicella sp.]